jgi:phosphate transport system substrate-binding protein
MSLKKVLLPLALVVLVVTTGAHANITGAGSTFVYPALSKWAADYQAKTKIQINYQAIGSGGGISQINAKTVEFAATDKPLTSAQLQSGHLSQFPIIMGGIVMADNVKTNGTLVLNGSTLADIYLGKIKFWDDPALKALNPKLTLPHQAITVIYRADGSGTTYNFTRYLDGESTAFKQQIGSDTSVSWPTGIGGKGNAGVANFVKTVPGSIGYVEYAYAKENNLPMANMKLPSGQIVVPNNTSFNAAAVGVKLMSEGILDWSKNNDHNAWPMMAATYALVRSDLARADAQQVYAFFKFAYGEPDVARALAYVPLSSTMVTSVVQSWPKQ